MWLSAQSPVDFCDGCARMLSIFLWGTVWGSMWVFSTFRQFDLALGAPRANWTTHRNNLGAMPLSGTACEFDDSIIHLKQFVQSVMQQYVAFSIVLHC